MSGLRCGSVLWASAVGLVLAGGAVAEAEVQPHQIARLILLRSDCDLGGLAPPVRSGTGLRVVGQCRNASFFPDGIAVACADADDDRSCRIETEPVRFRDLELLQREPR